MLISVSPNNQTNFLHQKEPKMRHKNYTPETRLLTFVAILLSALITILILTGCDEDGNIIIPDPAPTATATQIPTTTPSATPTATQQPTQEPTQQPTAPPDNSLFIPDNCNNPPKQISSTSGFKCKGSETRGDTIVCLLPWEFTWQPYTASSDPRHPEYLESSKRFAAVHLVLKNGSFVDLNWSGYANPVYLQRGKVTRQHWRDESRTWSSVSNRVDYIEMQRGNRRTCLKF